MYLSPYLIPGMVVCCVLCAVCCDDLRTAGGRAGRWAPLVPPLITKLVAPAARLPRGVLIRLSAFPPCPALSVSGSERVWRSGVVDGWAQARQGEMRQGRPKHMELDWSTFFCGCRLRATEQTWANSREALSIWTDVQTPDCYAMLDFVDSSHPILGPKPAQCGVEVVQPPSHTPPRRASFRPFV
jgi:hypothetical protein